ncbi:MAG: hypothetical protein MUO27_01955, partial [Sedimentisphaerales bacterium]|nr:hypothetical protein [Sedimentisphaerales bacterium]
FNPFHLTNLTHTFVISISQNAEGWRNVHEWWPAFRWDNPVGTSFPFMMMLIAGIGLMTMWLFSRLLAPKQLKGPKTEMESQRKRFNVLTRILGFEAGVLICWSVLISFSLVDVSLGGFLLSGLFVGVLWAAVFINVHCIYIVIPLALFALYTANAAQGYTGRYIFPFITIPCYVMMYIVGAQISKKARFSMVSIFFVLAAAIAALVLEIVLVDPFKLKEPLWHVKQFWGLQRIWGPACEANLEMTYANLFPVLYVINAVCVGVWLAIPFVKGLFGGEAEQEGALEGETYQLPRIDLALITIAVLTVYMAFRSRRFITIAAYVTCPIIAMLIQQVLQTVSAAWNFHRRGRLAVSQMPTALQRWLATGAAAVVMGLGVWWGLKFKMIYMDPWPTEAKLTSMFIRMTASHAKPFAVCQFITANNLQGNMFNYWTEGGFIAWGQEPDPKTGRTPLQLFMDGRAQAAYKYNDYMRWSEIMFGGDIVQRAKIRKQSLTVEDYVQIGEWLGNQLKQHDVWVVLMPANQFDTPFVHGLEHNPNWRLVFINDKEKLYVDISRPRGAEIFRGIEDGTTKYPDESSRNIMIANNALVFGTNPESFTKGLECAIKAYEENPVRLSMQMIQVFYDRYPPLRPQILEFLKRSLDDFEANRKKYLSSDGYYHRIAGALTAIGYLEPIAEKENDKDLVQLCEREKGELIGIASRINDKRW